MPIRDQLNDREMDSFTGYSQETTAKKVRVLDDDKTAYGESSVAINYPYISGSAGYGFIPTNFRTFTATGGTSTTSDNVFYLYTSTSVGSYAAVQSFRSINYKTGTGALVRFGAIFDSTPNLGISGVGAISIGDELSFGYESGIFGIWHRHGGKPEVQTLTLTAGATGSENATLTLNGVAYTVPLTSGATTLNAKEIADYITANVTTFFANQNSNTVVFISASDGDKTDPFLFTSATASGTFVQTTSGVTKTSRFYPQSEWNGEPMDIDPSKGNSYQIKYENGYGDARFYIEEQHDGDYKLVHYIPWSNENTTTNLLNPSLRIGGYVASLGSTTSFGVKIAYVAGFIQGQNLSTRNPRAFSNTKSISTTSTNIFTIRTKRVFNGRANQAEIEPRFLTLANDGSKTAIFELRGNPTVSGSRNFLDVGTNLISESEVAGTTVTGGTLLSSFSVAKGTTIAVNLSDIQIRLPPTTEITVAGYMTSGAAADLTASLTWYEDL